MIVKDREDDRERVRGIVEYAMAFLKPEVMQSILKKRELDNLSEGEDTKEIFEQQVEQMFGKPIASSGSSGV